MVESGPEGLTAPQREVVVALLGSQGIAVEPEAPALALRGDGSDRRFFRFGGDTTWMVVIPDPNAPRGRAEAQAAAAIGRHLHSCGVPVPEIYGFEPESGVMVCEDLGDQLLHTRVLALLQERPNSDSEILDYYREVLDQLLLLQVQGRVGFQPHWCWDTVHYDRQVMLERESGYFLHAFYRDYLGWTAIPTKLLEEFQELAERVAALPADFLLHRDFQSRNLMVKGGRVRIIDFQGARFGPLAYDLASLLLDPYVGLTLVQQEHLLAEYLKRLRRLLPVEEAAFRTGYQAVAVQRNLQIIGAFAFLSKQKKKLFFQPYLQPALHALATRLESELAGCYPVLQALVATIRL